MAEQTSTRRGLLGAMALAPVIAASPLAAAPSSDFAARMAASRAAECRFNSLTTAFEVGDPAGYAREEAMFIAAGQRADAATPTNWREFAQLFEHMVDYGESRLTEENEDRLLAHLRRLVAGGLN